jgi:opacity protein-like surface antigen
MRIQFRAEHWLLVHNSGDRHHELVKVGGMKRTQELCIVLFLVLASGFGLAQQADIAASVSGVITNQSSGSFMTRTATTSAGGLFSFRYFPHRNGIEANFGYTKNSQQFEGSLGNVIAPVQTSVYELTGDYVLRFGHDPIRPFAFLGGGMLIFGPTDSAIKSAVIPISRQTRPAFLYGAGADFRITDKAAIRGQYRGLLYEAPDFGNSNLHTGYAMHTIEPSVGLVYRF